ncbi:MAG TPA: carbon starvation protein A [Leptospiraceae bacterium]|nr:carbon starvation protein A [Leptospiraceae bacterium]HMX31050.1 carbon starvation protein A [Leptospiraceae bacterium]HMY31866.1 carbon starvation protein A [Leptospiraceae bacterium]HMZ63855.1 carbon starvation protein A [Leptospiraceae bacterium]HNA06319.1 carbon starvation protein A [Leptospiraceae bacterium]
MIPAIVVSLCLIVYILGYRFYSRYLAEKVFVLRGSDFKTPAHIHNDGVDYVPTKPSVLFGHHFASIAGLAPILGPAVAVIWGWFPAMVWVVLGGIFMGCVHDMGALIISVRHDGKSIGQVAEDLLGHRARSLFHIIIFFLVSLAMGVFVLVIAGLYSAPPKPIEIKTPTVIEQPVTVKDVKDGHDSGELKKESPKFHLRSNFPESVTPTLALMILALIVGYLHYKKSFSLGWLTVVSFFITLVVIYYSMNDSFLDLIGLNDIERAPSTDSWKLILLAYAFLASVTPVWLLLQSRDYINSFLLYLGIILVYLGYFVGSFSGNFPSFNASAFRTDGIGMDILPFVFITIACGAISGFHSLVSSGTTAKQIAIEKDSRVIGYGGMIGESLLGLTAVIACTIGFSSSEEWNSYYKSWAGLQGLNVQVGAYIYGTSRFLGEIGIPEKFGQGFIALIVISFALTSLDSATRLLRYNIEEIVHSFGSKTLNKILANRYSASLLACASIAFFAFLKVNVNGQMKPAGLALWKVFGTTNQLLAGLALVVIFIYLVKTKRPMINIFLPMVFVLSVTLWAMVGNFMEFLSGPNPNYLLAAVGGILIILTLWLLIEGFLVWRRIKGNQN